MIERIHTGQRMSKIVKHNGTVYLCGQVGAGDTVAEQTRDCLSRVDALLAEAGTSKENILQAIVWVADMADFAEMNAVWDAWVPRRLCPGPRLRRGAPCTLRAEGRGHRYRCLLIVGSFPFTPTQISAPSGAPKGGC